MFTFLIESSQPYVVGPVAIPVLQIDSVMYDLSKVIQLVRTEQNPSGSRFQSLNHGDVFSLIHSGQFTFLVNDFGALTCFGIRSPYGQIFLFCHQQPFHSEPPWMSDTLISG